jgi:hypothetical protein
MTPYINESVVRYRIARLRDQADQRREAHVARTGTLRRTGQHPVRDAVGHGLIALGARLVDSPPAVDTSHLKNAA